MLGFVMNDVHHNHSSAYYNYKYKYKKYGYGGYGYGYGYYGEKPQDDDEKNGGVKTTSGKKN